ncbi:short-chain collagen C4-like, partial [Saccostrea cucullata]|uniref:short-chain collagen C4-like n=1 Tax=Saccostrea cuccullata TaxID=36930 RepID=UPI002ED180FB
ETKSAGAVYTRWGRYECPQNDTELVYKGFTGSSYYTHTGGSVNYICLPYDPLWGKYNDVIKNDNQNLHGVEYAANSININGTPFDSKLRGHGVPCAVCRSTKRSSVLRIPGRNKCFKDWHLEYAGYLMADKFTHASATEYACVDEQPEKSKTGPVSKGGKYFSPVEAYCGDSLQCPPYVHGREITCAICTK